MAVRTATVASSLRCREGRQPIHQSDAVFPKHGTCYKIGAWGARGLELKPAMFAAWMGDDNGTAHGYNRAE
jgi:hypothetical protein